MPDPILPDGLDEVRKALDANTGQATAMSGGLPSENLVSKYVLSPLGKITDVLDTDLNLVTNALRPVFTSINPKLDEVYKRAPLKFGMPNVVPSDLIEESLRGTPGDKWTSKILGFAADVALSPTTYLAGIGTLTKEGKLFAKIKSLTEAGQEIKVDSSLGADIALHYGAKEATPALIGKAVKDAEGFATPTLEQQAVMGRRALINIGIPFTKAEIPLVNSALFFRGIDKAKVAFKESKFGEVFNSVFSTSSGNPVFDKIRSAMLGAGRLAAKDMGIAPSADIAKLVDEGVKITGLPKDEFMQMINDIGETGFKGGVAVNPRGLIDANSVINTFGTNIEKQIVDGTHINKIVDSIPGISNIAMDEKQKLVNKMMYIAQQKQAGFDVFGTGFLQIPEDFRTAIANESTHGIGIKMAQEVDPNGFIKYTNFASVLKAYTQGIKFKGLKIAPGTEAGLLAMVGKDEYLRLIKNEKSYEAIKKQRISNSFTLYAENRGRWFSENPNEASTYGSKQYFVDVPKETESYYGTDVHVLPVRVAAQAKPISKAGPLAPGFKRLFRGEMSKGIGQSPLQELISGSEASQARDTVNRLVAHVDQAFSTAYTLHQTNPDFLAKIHPKMAKIMAALMNNNDWKIQSLIEQYHLDPELAKQYPQIFDLAQTIRGHYQNQLQLEANVGTHEFVGDTSYIPHVPTKEAREQMEKINPAFKGASRNWNMEHQSMLQRETRNVDPRKVTEAMNTGVLSKKQGKLILEKAAQDNASAGEYIDKLVKNKNISLSENAANNLFHYLTVSEVKLLAKNGKLKLLGFKPMDAFFEENPALQVLVRGVRGAKAITSADFYEASSQFGTLHPTDQPLPDGMSFVKNEAANPLAGITTKTVFEGGKPVTKYFRMAFDTGVAKGIDALHYSLQLPAGTHPILSTFDGLQNEWKAWTLALFPVYHTRNLIGNLWNNYLAGIHTPEPYFKALSVQNGRDITIIAGNGEKYTGKQIARLAEEKGIVDIGWYHETIDDTAKNAFATGIQKYYQKAKAPVNFGLEFGNRLQNNANLALFIRRIEEGYSLDHAAMEVKKYQFDYKDLTDFEKNFLKRTFPFYSWSRKNIPLQLEALLTTPARMMAISKVRNAMETNYDGIPDERLLPDYVTQNYPIRTNYDKKRNQYSYFLLGSWLPAADIDKIFDPAQWFKNQLTPLLKEPAQQLANRDFYTGQEIDKGDQYQRISIFSKNISFNLPAWETHALKNIRLISEPDKLSSPDLNVFEKVTRATVGKLYPFDEQKQRVQEFDAYKARLNNLRSMLRQDRKQGNTDDANRILNTIQKVQQERAAKLSQ